MLQVQKNALTQAAVFKAPIKRASSPLFGTWSWMAPSA
jgi:hypothetical protein